MKLAYFLLLPALFAQCAKTPAVDPSPSQTYAEREVAVVQAVAPLVAGEWRLTNVHYSKRPYFDSPAGWPKDTVIAQLATLTLKPSVSRPPEQLHPRFEGQLTYAGKTYPVAFALSASPDRVAQQQGPPAYFLLEYNFPDGTHQTEVEEQFLRDVGLVGYQFSLEAEAGQAIMHWQGLNKHLQSITLRK